MGDEQGTVLFREKIAPGPAGKASARVEKNGLAAGPDQHAAGGPAEPGKFRPVDGQGAPDAQQLDLHGVTHGAALLSFNWH